ncbi:MAG TPA: flavodoxin domain-containing protein, partial [Thermomicrobiales bacterium]|nr:flavodoxin domain-containing protein [Thermomicrobiales bacterium]
ACIGRQFALQEATLVFGMLLNRFEFADVENYQLRIKQTLTIKPEGFRLGITPRPGRNAYEVGAPPSVVVEAPVVQAAPTPAANGHGAPLLVLFGSNLGSAEDLAYRIANDAARRGFAAQVAPLDDRVSRLPTDAPVVVVTASYNGTPPDNARAFCEWLQSPGLAADALAGVRYAVFGCGNHEWTATYQAIPRLVDDELAAHGAERLAPRGEGDAAGDFDGQAGAWIAGLWGALGAAAGLDAAQMAPTAKALYAIERVSAPANPFLSEAVRPLTVLVNRELQRNSERSTRHIEVALPEGTAYQTGDHLGVIARNGVELVTRAMRRFDFAGDAFVRIRRHGAGTPLLPLDQPIAVVDLLSRYLDLQEVAGREQVAALADAAADPIDRAALRALATNERYGADVLAKRVSVLDLLERFPSVELGFGRYLEMLHPLRVRYYSISSSPAMAPEACALTVAVVEGPARSGQGAYRGIASGYLQRHPPASVVDGYVRAPNIPFRPPANPKTPIVMIGPGTGLAPFRGFLQERAAQAAKGETLGPAVLFFGCRNPKHDFIYQDELEAYARNGIVTLHTAFSRPDDGANTYVQDSIRANGEAVWSLIDAGGVVYVCGDGGKMEPAVRQAIADLATTYGGKSAEEAKQWQADLAAAGCYLADVWANG